MLPLAAPGQTALPAPSIMDRALAAKYGSAYVQLAAFAIDIDRAYLQAEELAAELAAEPQPPFAWEVFLTQCYLLSRIDPNQAAPRALLAQTCLELLEQDPSEQGFGSQLLFAVHDAITRGLYPEELAVLFRTWRRRPKQLHKALSALWADAGSALASCAAYCLALPLDPKLAPPTREALSQMQARVWPLPTKNPPAPDPEPDDKTR